MSDEESVMQHIMMLFSQMTRIKELPGIKETLKACNDAELVFLDPDNGATESKGGKNSRNSASQRKSLIIIMQDIILFILWTY